MPVYQLRNDKQQVRFVPEDDIVIVFTYDMIDGKYSACWGKNEVMLLKVARSYWCRLLSIGFREIK